MTNSDTGQPDAGGGGSSQESLPGDSGLYAEMFGDEPIAPAPEQGVTEASDNGTDAATEVTEAKVEADTQQVDDKAKVKEEAPETKADETTTETWTDDQYNEAWKKFQGNDERAAKLDEREAKLKLQEAGVDKHFNENAGKFKALYEDAGITEGARKADKKIGKDMDKVGDKPPSDYVAKDYLHNDFLKMAVEKRIITPQQAKRFGDDKAFLNVIFNAVASGAHNSAKAMYSDLDGKITPMVQQRETMGVETKRSQEWNTHLNNYAGNYGQPSDEQLKAFALEYRTDASLRGLVDDEGGDPARVERRIRQIINDPGVKSEAGFGDVPPPREVRETVKVVEVGSGTESPEPKKKKSPVDWLLEQFES